MSNIFKSESYNNMIAKVYPNFSKQSKNKIQTAMITFQVTDACNLKCTYCYQINKNTHVMPLEVAQKFIDLLIDNDENTQKYIDTRSCDAAVIEFIGGEPFLQTELMDQIIQYFIQKTIEKDHPWQYNWRISICSNGTLYFNTEVQNFIKKYLKKLAFSISIDGNKQLHDSCRIFPNGTGSYDIAISAVHHFLTHYQDSIGNKMTISPENIKFLSEAVINLLNENYHEINLNCTFEKGWTEEHAKILYQQLKQLSDYILENNLEDNYISLYEENFFRPKSFKDSQNWCGGNGQMLAIDWKGDIYPCIRYMESSLGDSVPPLIIGNINNGIAANKKCEECIKLLRSINRLTQSSEECIKCPVAEGCAWCQAYNYQDSGGNANHRATYICIMHKARALANCYYWNKKYKKNNELKRMKLWLPDEEALQIIDNKELQLLKDLQYPIK